MAWMAGSQQGALKLSGRVLGVAAPLLLLLFARLHGLRAQQLPSASTATTTDTLRLYYLGYPIGWERYTIKSVDSGVQLDADFDYIDRGRRQSSARCIRREFPSSPGRTRVSRGSASIAKSSYT